MSKLIIEFQHEDVMQPRPWPVGVNADDIVTSGLGHDDGARLLGFGLQGEQTVTVFPDAARKDPASIVGLVPTFSSAGGGMFEWSHPVREMGVIQDIKSIESPEDLANLAGDLGVRSDWHEPDEQEVGAWIRGRHLDNAMGSTMRDIGEDNSSGEYNIVITKAGQPVAVVNLATLLGWGASIVGRREQAYQDGINAVHAEALT